MDTEGNAVFEVPAAPEPELSEIPKPITCDPANPNTMLEPVKVEKGPEPGPYGDKIYTTLATYTNSKSGQAFLLAASSGEPDELDKVVQNLKVCYEALDTGIPDSSKGESDTTNEASRASASEFLNANPYNTLFEFELLTKDNINPENLVAVHFIVDPTYYTENAGRIDDFQSKCSRSASISVGVKDNNAHAELFSPNLQNSRGQTTDARPGMPSSTVSHNNGALNTTYDAQVHGPGGTVYWVNGTWIKGIGGQVCR